MRHPATFSNVLLPIIAFQIQYHAPPDMFLLILDPFAGIGKIFELEKLIPGCVVWANEIEPEWAAKRERSRVGDALDLSWAASGWFTVICTSPCYGNRMADHHNARDISRRNTYRHALGRPLSDNNAGELQWGMEYRSFHVKAWAETSRVLCYGGLFILNISNHIRKGVEQLVSEWHRDTLIEMGFSLLDDIHVMTPRNKFGANRNLRVGYEHVYVFRKGTP
jgi:hypothetical protein